MKKISPDYLPLENPSRDELRKQYFAKDEEYEKAAADGNLDLMDKIEKEKSNLITELRMINPNIPLTVLEGELEAIGEFAGKDHQKLLNGPNTEFGSDINRELTPSEQEARLTEMKKEYSDIKKTIAVLQENKKSNDASQMEQKALMLAVEIAKLEPNFLKDLSAGKESEFKREADELNRQQYEQTDYQN